MALVRYKQLVQEGIFSNRMDAKRKQELQGFPAAIELGPNTIAWDRAEVDEWIASRPRRRPKCDAYRKADEAALGEAAAAP